MGRFTQDILIVLRKELISTGRSRVGLYAMAFVFFVWGLRAMVIASSLTPETALVVLPILVSQASTWWALASSLSVLHVLSGPLLTYEKHTKRIEALIATPLTLRSIWVGKATFIWVISVSATWLITAFSIIILNMARHPIMAPAIPRPPEMLLLGIIGPGIILAIIHLFALAMLTSWNSTLIKVVLMFIWLLPLFRTRSADSILYRQFSWGDDLNAIGILLALALTTYLLRNTLNAERLVLTQG